MPRNKPSDVIEDRMTNADRWAIAALVGQRESARRDLKKLRDRIRTRILYEIAKEQSQ